jgi:hypothetical protein
VNAALSTLQKMLYAWTAATLPIRRNRTSLKTIRCHNQDDLDLWFWIKKVRSTMESIIHGFFDSLDSTASPFTHLRAQDREECQAQLHFTNSIKSSKNSFHKLGSPTQNLAWAPGAPLPLFISPWVEVLRSIRGLVNDGLLNPQVEKLGFTVRNRVIAR